VNLIDQIPCDNQHFFTYAKIHNIDDMKDKLEQRLQTLKTEYEAGQKVLAELEAKQTNVRETLLRISGAIQVLEEALSEDPEPEPSISADGENAPAAAIDSVAFTE
jgi:predicted nuclease with TOPRIM domain